MWLRFIWLRIEKIGWFLSTQIEPSGSIKGGEVFD
jgi:hypothetical protein